MGLFEDITRNQLLVEMTGKLGSYLLEQKRERDFAKATNFYTEQLERLRRQEGNQLSVESVKKMQDASLAYLAETAKIGKDYEKKARELAESNERLYSNFLNDAINVAKRIDEEDRIRRDLQERQVLSNVINHPLYSQYTNLRRSMTAQELGGEKGRKLSELRAQIIADADPQRVATVKVWELLESVPFNQPSASAFGYWKEMKDDYMRVMNAASKGLNLTLSRNEAEKIVNQGGLVELKRIIEDKIRKGKYTLPLGIGTVDEAVSVFSQFYEKDYAKNESVAENLNRRLTAKEEEELQKRAIDIDKKVSDMMKGNKTKTQLRNVESAFRGLMVELARIRKRQGVPMEVVRQDLESQYKEYFTATDGGGILSMFRESPEDKAKKEVQSILESVYGADNASNNVGLGGGSGSQMSVGVPDNNRVSGRNRGLGTTPSIRPDMGSGITSSIGSPSVSVMPSDNDRAVGGRVGTSLFKNPDLVNSDLTVARLMEKERLRQEVLNMTEDNYNPETLRKFTSIAGRNDLKEVLKNNSFVRGKIAGVMPMVSRDSSQSPRVPMVRPDSSQSPRVSMVRPDSSQGLRLPVVLSDSGRAVGGRGESGKVGVSAFRRSYGALNSDSLAGDSAEKKRLRQEILNMKAENYNFETLKRFAEIASSEELEEVLKQNSFLRGIMEEARRVKW